MHENDIDGDYNGTQVFDDTTPANSHRNPVIDHLLTTLHQFVTKCQDDPQSRHYTLLRLIGEAGAMRDLIDTLGVTYSADTAPLRAAMADFWRHQYEALEG